jgi:hypothetical protein
MKFKQLVETYMTQPHACLKQLILPFSFMIICVKCTRPLLYLLMAAPFAAAIIY